VSVLLTHLFLCLFLMSLLLYYVFGCLRRNEQTNDINESCCDNHNDDATSIMFTVMSSVLKNIRRPRFCSIVV